MPQRRQSPHQSRQTRSYAKNERNDDNDDLSGRFVTAAGAPVGNVFAVANKDGAPRTMFKPDEGRAYWDKQKDRESQRQASRRSTSPPFPPRGSPRRRRRSRSRSARD